MGPYVDRESCSTGHGVELSPRSGPNGMNLHPDHIAISRFASDAVAAADPRWFPETGEPHTVARMLWSSTCTAMTSRYGSQALAEGLRPGFGSSPAAPLALNSTPKPVVNSIRAAN